MAGILFSSVSKAVLGTDYTGQQNLTFFFWHTMKNS